MIASAWIWVALATVQQEPVPRDGLSRLRPSAAAQQGAGTEALPPSAERAIYPWLATDAQGRASANWLVPGGEDGNALLWARRLPDGSWTEAEEVARGQNWFVNWADHPVHAVDAAGRVLATWLQKVPGSTYSYHVHLRLRDAEGVWGEAHRLHEDDSPTEHGFVSIAPVAGGGFVAAWRGVLVKALRTEGKQCGKQPTARGSGPPRTDRSAYEVLWHLPAGALCRIRVSFDVPALGLRSGGELRARLVSLDGVHGLLLYPDSAEGCLYTASRLCNAVSAAAKWKGTLRMDYEEEEEEDEDEDEVVEETPVADADNAAAATMTDGDDNARADPAMRARTSTAMIDSDDEDEVADGDLEPQPAVPIRLGPFAEPDYVLREVVMSEEQEEWARDRMRNAHAHIIEHLSSRPGYAEIMLMTDPTGDALAEQYVPTGGETAAVKDNNKQNWAWLKSHEKVGELSRQMEGDLARDIVQTISIKRHDSPKYHKIKRESNDDAERAEAEDWLREWRDDKKRRDGMQMALRLMYGVSAFRNHDAGPWVALLAWWLRLDDRAQLQPPPADEARSTVDDAQGRELCFMHSNTKSTGPWLESASKKYWDGLWVFMDRLYYWLRQDHQSVINEAVALKNDPAFTEETSWANLGVRLNAGRR